MQKYHFFNLPSCIFDFIFPVIFGQNKSKKNEIPKLFFRHLLPLSSGLYETNPLLQIFRFIILYPQILIISFFFSKLAF